MDVISARARLLLALTFAAGALGGAAATVPALAVALIAAALFEHFDAGGLTVMQLVFTAIASVMLRLGLGIVARVAAGSAALLASRDLRAAAARTIGALPLGELAESRPGSFEGLLLGDVDAVNAFVCERLPELASAYGLLATAFLVLVVRDREVALVAFAAGLAAMALVAAGGARPRDRDADREARDALGAAIFEAARATDLDRSLPDASLASRAVPGLAPLALGGPHVAPALLVLFAALGLRTTAAWVIAFGTLAASAPARGAWRRIRALLERPAIVDGAAAFPARSDVRFRDVTFAYPSAAGGRGDVLRGIDVHADAGAVTAIVGPSGCGKTTFTRLAARFWDVDRGAVEIGGVDVRALPLDALMRGITFVFQDVALLDDTVAVNLRLGRPAASDAEVVAAARAAGAHDFIAALPHGYDTTIGERGTFLSRGERQRLQIARAFLKDAPIVILDEPTASMDPATEAGIADALAPLLRGKTVIVVAHRLSTIVAADKIVVLAAAGSVEAQGTHDELLAASATYARMWAAYGGSSDSDASTASIAS